MVGRIQRNPHNHQTVQSTMYNKFCTQYIITHPGILSSLLVVLPVRGAITCVPTLFHFGCTSYAPGGGPGGVFTGRNLSSAEGAKLELNLGRAPLVCDGLFNPPS